MNSQNRHLAGLDGLRGLLILYMINGHFGQFFSNHPLFLALSKQQNMVVGVFFMLSGYVLAWSRKSPAAFVPFMKKRLGRIYPVYFIAFMVFLPLYLFIKLHYQNSWGSIARSLLIHLALLQAWHPATAQDYNSPSWFLSSLLLSYLVFIPIQRLAARLSTLRQLVLGSALWTGLLMLRLVYARLCPEQGIEGLDELACQPTFDWFRFLPLFNLLEFLMGVVLAHFVQSREASGLQAYANPLLTVSAGLIAALVGMRAYFSLNDLLARSLFLLPAFALLLASLPHASNGLARILKSASLSFLGQVSFSMFVWHSPIGQLFYKKVVKQSIWGDQPHYAVYLLTVLLVGTLSYRYIERSGRQGSPPPPTHRGDESMRHHLLF